MRILEMLAENGNFCISENHLILIDGKGWIRAGEARLGDILACSGRINTIKEDENGNEKISKKSSRYGYRTSP